MQTRKQSLIEAVTSVAIGLVVALITQAIVFPLFGIRIQFGDNLAIAGVFTGVSVVRSYFVRRLFNWWFR